MSTKEMEQEIGKIKNKVLVVDDNKINRMTLDVILKDEYDVFEAENGREAIEMVEEHDFSAMLLDLDMPEMNGYQVMEQIAPKKKKILPIIVITGDNTIETEQECLKLGAADFIPKPFSKVIVKKRLENIVEMFENRRELQKKVDEQTVLLRRVIETLRAQKKQLEEENNTIIEILGSVVEYRNIESGSHIKRVKTYVKILGEEYMRLYQDQNLTKELLDRIIATSPLHDLGKIAIPDKILLKPGRLTEEEYDYMKSHTLRGCELIEQMDAVWGDDYAKTSYEICRYHHERYDGNGYPDGLKEDEIPLGAQLVALADVYDALIHERCYKEAVSKNQAYMMILSGECGVFSPRIMEAFRSVKERFEQVEDEIEKER